jgi:epsin
MVRLRRRTNFDSKLTNSATSNGQWGPGESELAELAQMTLGESSAFDEIIDILDQRMNEKEKNWRHVLKSLNVLNYLLHEGSELCIVWTRTRLHIIETLQDFQYVDRNDEDVGIYGMLSACPLICGT